MTSKEKLNLLEDTTEKSHHIMTALRAAIAGTRYHYESGYDIDIPAALISFDTLLEEALRKTHDALYGAGSTVVED
jgi:hypothetical protein